MFKLGVVVWVFFTVHAIWGDAFAADPVIRSVDLDTFGDNIGGIGSLYNSTWSVVGKCCPVGQMLRKSNENSTEVSSGYSDRCKQPLSNETINYSPLFMSFNASGMFVPPGTRDQFIAVVGNPCKYEMYELDPQIEEDEFYLLANGSIYKPHNPGNLITMQPGRDYCMEFIPGQGLTVLVCYQPELTVVRADTRLAFYAVGLLTSVPFLLGTIICYLITYQLRDIYGLALCCYSGCLALAFLTLAVLQLGGHLLDDNGCDGLAFVIQFSFIACFFWLSAMTIEMWRLIRLYRVVGSAIRNERPASSRFFFYYSLWGWGLPAILIIIALALNLNPIIPWSYVKRSGDEDPSCWSGVQKEALPYFYAPAGLLILCNVILFTISGFNIAKTQGELDVRRLARNVVSDREDRRVFRELRLTFILTIVLLIIMAINWSMELISVSIDSDLLAWSIFDFINALQGVLVFGLFVLRKPARTLVWRRIKMLTGSRESDADAAAEMMSEMTLLPVINNNNSNHITVTPSRVLNQ